MEKGFVLFRRTAIAPPCGHENVRHAVLFVRDQTDAGGRCRTFTGTAWRADGETDGQLEARALDNLATGLADDIRRKFNPQHTDSDAEEAASAAAQADRA